MPAPLDTTDAAAAALAAAQAATLPQLQALLEAAAAQVCPSAASVLAWPREAAHLTLCSDGPDVRCHAPAAAFRRLVASADEAPRADDERCGVFCSSSGGVVVRTRSPAELLICRSYVSPAELADAWLAALPPAALSALVGDCWTTAHGVLLFSTRAQLAAQLAQGRLLCAACGRFCAGTRGLRDHAQRQHKEGYEAARETVAAARRAVIPFTGPLHAQQDGLGALLHARAAAVAAARDALHPGLAAARDGDVATLQTLLASGWDAATCVDRHGSTALLWAAGAGQLAAVQLLVAAGVSVDAAQKRDGRGAVHWAARNGHVDTLAWLVAQGASPGAVTRDGTTPFHWAAWQGHMPVLSWLMASGTDWASVNVHGCNAGQWAAMAGDVAVCAFLHAAGLDWGLVNHNGHSAVHKAAGKGRLEVCRWLLEAPQGPRLGRRHLEADGDGNTPSRLAAAEGHAELAAWLLAREMTREGSATLPLAARGL